MGQTVVAGLTMFLLACGMSMPSSVTAGETVEALCTFEGGTHGWRRRTYDAAGKPATTVLGRVAAVDPAVSAQGMWLRLPVTLPGPNEFVMPIRTPWLARERLRVTMYLPEALPASAVVTFFTKDWDHLWRQIRIPLSGHGRGLVDFDLPLAGDEAAARWRGVGHGRPWHTLSPGQIIEFGCALDVETGATDVFAGDVFVVGAWLTGTAASAPMTGPPVRLFGLHPAEPRVGELVELGFEWHLPFADAFDPKQVRVVAAITTPAGVVEEIPGFYFEDFLYDPRPDRPAFGLSPHGRPRFKVRYTPRQSGQHVVSVTVTMAERSLKLAEVSFAAQPPERPFRGYVRVDETDKRYLAFDNGEFFWGIGMNVRSPYDTRYKATVPFSEWTDEGLELYRRLFDRFAASGINVVEVWMSSWWLALEWINEAPGYHGVGYMNQYKAWMLDTLLRWAEERGIYIILVFNNHGKFGTLNDTEWARNPYNVDNGGFLANCEHFFSDARAKTTFKRLVDYVLARWGYSPNILMWKLFTEIDLTGTTYEFYHNPVVAAWHAEMAAYVRAVDRHQRPVTTHWMLDYQRINDGVADRPELDVLTADAYYTSGGTAELLELLRGTGAFAVRKGKPVLVTEFGGSPHADSLGNLIKQAHLGIWQGAFCGSPVAPLFWWFALVDERNLYGSHAALDRFMRGEDLRGMRIEHWRLENQALELNALRADDRLLLWGFDTAYYFADDENLEPARREGVTLTLGDLKPGDYAVEFWDCADGRLLSTTAATVAANTSSLALELLAFRRDIAIKLRRTNP